MIIALMLQAVPLVDALPRINYARSEAAIDYPRELLRRGETGVVTVSIDVSAQGRAIACFVTESSRFDRLDEASCAAARKLRFEPQIDGSGQPIAASFHTTFNWGTGSKIPTATMPVTLDVTATPPGYARPSRLQIAIGADGKVVRCRLQESSGSDAADSAACSYLFTTFRSTGPVSTGDRPALTIRNLIVTFAVPPHPSGA